MDSQLLVKFLCLWLVFSCILPDQVESFSIRVGRRRRNAGLSERRRERRKRDSSVFPKRELARPSSIWDDTEYHDSASKGIKTHHG